MGRRNAYKIYNINTIEDEVGISLYTFSRTIPDRYITRFLDKSSTLETITTLIETLIESDYDEFKVVIDDWEDLVFDIVASTDWIVRCVDDVYHVDAKVQFLLEDEKYGKNYEHSELYRVNIVLKR